MPHMCVANAKHGNNNLKVQTKLGNDYRTQAFPFVACSELEAGDQMGDSPTPEEYEVQLSTNTLM